MNSEATSSTDGRHNASDLAFIRDTLFLIMSGETIEEYRLVNKKTYHFSIGNKYYVFRSKLSRDLITYIYFQFYKSIYNFKVELIPTVNSYLGYLDIYGQNCITVHNFNTDYFDLINKGNSMVIGYYNFCDLSKQEYEGYSVNYNFKYPSSGEEVLNYNGKIILTLEELKKLKELKIYNQKDN